MALKKNKSVEKKLTLPSDKIVGIYGISSQEIESVLGGVIDIDDARFYTTTVKKEINFYCKLFRKKSEEFKQQFEKGLDILQLDILQPKRTITSLSTSEQRIFYLLLKVEFHPLASPILLKNAFKYLDRNNKKNLMNFFKETIREEQKLGLLEENINLLYHSTDYVFLMKSKEVLAKGDTKDILTKVDFLIENQIKVPDLPMITYQAKTKKDVKLFYHTDIRDIMKDIYKHV